jgi:hypothetical protein
VFKRLGDCTGSEIESAIGLIAQSRIERAWIAEQAAGPDRSELIIVRRFFATATDAERDLIAYWHIVKLVEDATPALRERGRCLTAAKLGGIAVEAGGGVGLLADRAFHL